MSRKKKKKINKYVSFFISSPSLIFFSSSFFLHSEERGGIGEVDQTSFFLGQCDFEIYVVPGIKRKRSISVELLTVTKLEKLKQCSCGYIPMILFH